MGTIQLGAVRVDPARNMVANAGASWSLEPKVMDVLMLLAAHPGEVLSREFLVENVWKVEYGADESLTRAVSLLRKTFREAGEAGEVIETIPKRGYRLALTPSTVAAALLPVHDAESSTTPPTSVPAPGMPDPVPATETTEAAPANSASTQGKPERGPSLRVMGIAAAAVLAVVALALFVFGQQAQSPGATPPSQLIAFFGFTPTGDDPALKATAEKANDAMFEAIRSNWVGTVARTETRGVAEDRRFERATELGARYAMGGDVRSDASGTTISIRFEDVPYRLTLWERSTSSPALDVAYLPAQAASQVSTAVWCIVKTREGLTRDTPELMSLIADRCQLGGGVDRSNASYIVSRMRAVVEADPGSAYNQAQLVNVLGLGLPYAPEPARAAWIAEAEATLQRAIDLDPNETNILFARICLGFGKNIPAAEWDALLLDAQANADDKDNFASAIANGLRSALLASTGRFAEALPHAVARNANKAAAEPGSLGFAMAHLGQIAEARADLEPIVAAYGPQMWDPSIPFALFLNAPDVDAMLKSPPSTIPKPTVECLRDVRKALASTDARVRSAGVNRVHECSGAGVINWRVTLLSLAALGDLDGAFAEAGQRSFSIPAIRSFETAVLFFPTTRAMRADPRFLPLVEKLGIMGYWRATNSRPDVCAAENAPFCAVLAKANAGP